MWKFTLCDPMDYRSLGSSVHWILQARILEQVAIPFSRSSQPSNQIQVSCIAGSFFIVWATREAMCMFIIFCIYRERNYISIIYLWLKCKVYFLNSVHTHDKTHTHTKESKSSPSCPLISIQPKSLYPKAALNMM